MKFFLVKRAPSLRGEITLSGDKSISHRSIILSAISPGKTIIENFPNNEDCLATVRAFQKLGIRITQGSAITVSGKGLYGLKRPRGPIFVGNSGTTLRILLGVLAGQNFEVTLTAGESLSRRPMLRVTRPLRMMGAQITATRSPQPAKLEEYPPITIKGGNLKPLTYRVPVASAQVKSAILLAGLYTEGVTRVIEPVKTRDHTERMLKLFKANVKPKENTIVIKGGKELTSPKRIYIPGDISSASFFMVLAAILPNSQITIRNVSLNPSRLGIVKVLKRMGANIRTATRNPQPANYEPMGDIIVKSSKLKGIKVKEEEVPYLIDELPILMIAVCFASGKTILEGVAELRVKETDRIKSMSDNLSKMGAEIKVLKPKNKPERIIIKGTKELRGCRVRSFGDHRTAMSMVIAGLLAEGKTFVDDVACINKSFPDFLSLLQTLIK